MDDGDTYEGGRGGRHGEIEADNKPAAEDISTSCGNNSNARVNANYIYIMFVEGRVTASIRCSLLETMSSTRNEEVASFGGCRGATNKDL